MVFVGFNTDRWQHYHITSFYYTRLCCMMKFWGIISLVLNYKLWCDRYFLILKYRWLCTRISNKPVSSRDFHPGCRYSKFFFLLFLLQLNFFARIFLRKDFSHSLKYEYILKAAARGLIRGVDREIGRRDEKTLEPEH